MEKKHYYFVGIKGTGMAALAEVLFDLGHQVEGSDIEKETFTEGPLRQKGIAIHNFDPANLQEGMTVVQGNAFADDHPEIVRAHELGLTVQSYPETVEELVQAYTSIGVAGAHGKTSTTALLSHVLGEVATTNYLIGDGEGNGQADARFFVFEADEYRDHFLAYHPDYAIMTNVDFDHPDYFADLNAVKASFETFGQQVKKGLFACGDNADLRDLKLDVPVYYYGVGADNDFVAKDIQRNPDGSTFKAYYHDELLGEFTIHLYGEHSVLNALATIAVAYFEKIDLAAIKDGLATFTGVKRRFAQSKVGDTIVIDDYAHHPAEIKATLDAARQKFPDKEIVAIFQPHTYSRLNAYLDGFAASLKQADKLYVTPIFGSIRENAGHISSANLTALVPGSEEITMDTVAKLKDHANGVLVFMGAGDIEKYEDEFVKLSK